LELPNPVDTVHGVIVEIQNKRGVLYLEISITHYAFPFLGILEWYRKGL